jgi:hypothetical protein
MQDPSSFIQWAKDDFGVKIVSLEGTDWPQKLYESLEPPFIPLATSPYAYGGQASFEAVVKLAVEKLGARTAVVEPYVSTDWNAERSYVYGRTFAGAPQYAQRIHFFADALDYKDLYDLPETLKYLGYCVVRPLQAFRVGDTVLPSPCTVGTAEANWVHCLGRFDVSLLGNKLSVLGMPFFQQDTTVGVCAHADLWMVARYLNIKGEVRRYRPPEIAELAASVLSVGPARAGLFDRQMREALANMGLSPMIEYPGDPFAAKEFIYSCIESELPVITGIPDHVIVVIGHHYDNNHKFEQGVRSMGDAVDYFIAHDDAAGPYMKIPVGHAVPAHGQSTQFLTLASQEVDVFIVSFPARIHMYWQDARDTALLWVEEIDRYAAGLLELGETTVWSKEDLQDLFLRPYLRSSSDFKCDLLDSTPDTRRNETIIAKYKCMHMPKYVWVIELARRSDLEGIPLIQRKIRGEIVLDSTANRHVPEETLLAFHFDGKMFMPRRKGRQTELIVVEEGSYSPLKRSKHQNSI